MDYKQIEYKVFQIGFNRCGTTSLYELFKGSGYKSVHYGKGWLARKMKDNIIKKIDSTAYPETHKVLDGVDQFTFYSDMESVYDFKPVFAYVFFKELYYDYPNAKFILNYRPFYDWVNSRLNFSDKYKARFLKNTGILDIAPKETLSAEDRTFWDSKINENLFDNWQHHYNSHIANVLDFFKDKPDRLLVYDLSKDSSDKIFNFFSDLDLDRNLWGQHNKSKNGNTP
jgi:hypothetical protein